MPPTPTFSSSALSLTSGKWFLPDHNPLDFPHTLTISSLISLPLGPCNQTFSFSLTPVSVVSLHDDSPACTHTGHWRPGSLLEHVLFPLRRGLPELHLQSCSAFWTGSFPAITLFTTAFPKRSCPHNPCAPTTKISDLSHCVSPSPLVIKTVPRDFHC